MDGIYAYAAFRVKLREGYALFGEISQHNVKLFVSYLTLNGKEFAPIQSQFFPSRVALL